MKSKLVSYSVLILVVLSGCDFLKMKENQEDENEIAAVPVARVHNKYLYAKDLIGLVAKNTSPEDSASRVERYINLWIRKQLIIDEASTKIDIDEAEIERKILDYRYSLLGYEYRSFYINNNLQSEVSDEEINTYYEKNQDNFPLGQSIIEAKL